MPRGVMTHGMEDIGDGLATSRQDGPEPQHKAPVIRWSGKRHIPSDLVVDSCPQVLRVAQPLISR